MHRRSRLTLPMLLVAALAAGARADDAATAARGAMKVTQLEGEAKATAKGGGEALPLIVGAVLHEGDVVQTGAGARVEIALASGTVLRLGESTRAELREAPPEGGRFRLKLALGNFWAHVAKLVGGERFEVETENGVAGVRGTEFHVEAAPIGGEDLLRVYEGKVQCDSLPGQRQWSHGVEPGRELRFHREHKSAGPLAFNPGADKSGLREWKRGEAGSDKKSAGSGSGKKDGSDKADKKEKKSLKERVKRLFRRD